MSRPTAAAWPVLWALVVGAAGCTPRHESHQVVIDGLRYQPESLTVKVGDSVVWINQDPIPHTVTSGPGRFDSQQIASGQSWRYVVPRAGTFDYTCTFHPMMKGALVAR